MGMAIHRKSNILIILAHKVQMETDLPNLSFVVRFTKLAYKIVLSGNKI